VAVKLVSGDGLATARALAERVGIGGRACRPAEKRTGGGDVDPTCDVFAEVFPEDKVGLVRALQRAGHEVGMTGDGVNDAPALRQAEVGIAVANATDVAKAAAGMVLTGPGLENVVAAIETGRRIYQRMLTYTLNKIVKTFVVALFLGLGLVATGKFVTTGRLVLLLLFANDFVTMSLATDRVSFSRRPDRWDIRTLAASGLALAALWLCVAFAVFLAGRDFLGLDLPRLQTLTFLFLVFSGQATVYLVRERGPFWRSRPSVWLVLTTLADIVAVSGLAISGFLMAPLAPAIVAAELGVTAVAMLGVDLAKIGIFRRLDVH
jgi:H+-transporting ATPase